MGLHGMPLARRASRSRVPWCCHAPPPLRFGCSSSGVLVGAVAVGFTAQAWWRHPDLSPWHTTRLANEFKAGAAAPRTLPEYQSQEARLFAELRERIYALPQASGEVNELQRYSAGSLVARIALDTEGNRCAPVFVLLAGTSAGLMTARRRSA